jgi:ABC-type lipoprotein release transport system permease subunit
MKNLKIILLGVVLGVVIGLWLGVNIGRERPLLSNPFYQESLSEKLKRLSGATLEKGGRALEKTGQELQDKLAK